MLRDSIVRSLADITLICVFAFGPLSAMADSTSVMSPAEISDASTPVRVQPRGSIFAPSSSGDKAGQKRITDFNDMQRLQEEAFGKKLTICRGC